MPTIHAVLLIIIFSKMYWTYPGILSRNPELSFGTIFFPLNSNNPLFRPLAVSWKFKTILFCASWHWALRHGDHSSYLHYLLGSLYLVILLLLYSTCVLQRQLVKEGKSPLWNLFIPLKLLFWAVECLLNPGWPKNFNQWGAKWLYKPFLYDNC